MDVVGILYYWTDLILFAIAVGLRAWAIVDCVTRKAAGFTAAEKLTKPAWLVILLISGLLGTYFGWWTQPASVLGVFSLVSIVVAGVYLADVRPAVREISGGR